MRLIVKSDKLVTGQTSVLDGGSKGTGTGAGTRKRGVSRPSFSTPAVPQRCTGQDQLLGVVPAGASWLKLELSCSPKISPLQTGPLPEANALLAPGTSLSPLPLFKATCSLDVIMSLTAGMGERVPDSFLMTQKD